MKFLASCALLCAVVVSALPSPAEVTLVPVAAKQEEKWAVVKPEEKWTAVKPEEKWVVVKPEEKSTAETKKVVVVQPQQYMQYQVKVVKVVETQSQKKPDPFEEFQKSLRAFGLTDVHMDKEEWQKAQPKPMTIDPKESIQKDYKMAADAVQRLLAKLNYLGKFMAVLMLNTSHPDPTV